MSMAGIGFIVAGSASQGSSSLLGDVLILGAAAAWVAYLFLSRGLRREQTSLQMTGWQTIFALLSILPFAAIEGTDWAAVTPGAWAAAILLGLLCSALCYWLYGRSLTSAGPLAVAIFVNLMPVTTIIAGTFTGEVLPWQAIPGGLLVVGSIFLVQLGERK